MQPRKPSLTASEKIRFLQEIREHLLLSPEEYRMLVLYVLRRHRQEFRGDTEEAADEGLAEAA
jgi:hypothetical protein